jgi:hypothetical protein
MYMLHFIHIYSHQHVSAAVAAIFRVMLLLEEYESTNVVSCVLSTLYCCNINIRLKTAATVAETCW